MLKTGNGDPKRCVENLVSIVRGEVPFDRVRGIDARIIDGPSEEAGEGLEAEATWNIETYEPRVNADNTEIKADVAEDGSFTMGIQISEVDDDDKEE